jgi:hypothetical protein
LFATLTPEGRFFGKFSLTHSSRGTLAGPSDAMGINQRSSSLLKPDAAVENSAAMTMKLRGNLIRIDWKDFYLG